jgi:hypothetical protein
MPSIVGALIGNYPVASFGSTPTMIFQDALDSTLDSIRITSLSQEVCYINCYVLHDDGSQTPIGPSTQVNPGTFVDLLLDSILNMVNGDLLFASTDSSGNLCSSFVSYRKFLTG